MLVDEVRISALIKIQPRARLIESTGFRIARYINSFWDFTIDKTASMSVKLLQRYFCIKKRGVLGRLLH
jgi:hypothetical protein